MDRIIRDLSALVQDRRPLDFLEVLFPGYFADFNLNFDLAAKLESLSLILGARNARSLLVACLSKDLLDLVLLY